MRIRPLLLHALLSFALAANGVGAAMASMHADCANHTVAVASQAAEPPCHENMVMAASSTHSGMQHGRVDSSSMSQHPSASDKQGCSDCADQCQCACIANGLAALMPPALLLHAVTGIAYTSAPSNIHMAPALPHPVRPPIG